MRSIFKEESPFKPDQISRSRQAITIEGTESDSNLRLWFGRPGQLGIFLNQMSKTFQTPS